VDYAGGTHPHFNFHMGAELLGYGKENSWKAAFAYASKHIAKAAKWVREDGKPGLADAHEVFGDIIAYFALMMEILDNGTKKEEDR